jgi:hypothetical protein
MVVRAHCAEGWCKRRTQPLTKPGENTFKVFVFDANGGPVSADGGQDRHCAHRGQH